MTLSTFAFVLGALCYLYGLPLLFHEKDALNWMKKLLKDDPLIRIVGVLVVLLCGAVLSSHWRITLDAEGLLIFLAWIGLVKGLYMTWGAKEYSDFAHGYLTKPHPLLHGFLGLVWGALLMYLSFVIQN